MINFKKIGNMETYIVTENGKQKVYRKETMQRMYVKRLMDKINELNIEYRIKDGFVCFNKENFDKVLKIANIQSPEELESFRRLLYEAYVEIVYFPEVDGYFIIEEFTEDKECHSTYVVNLANEVIKDFGWKDATYKDVSFCHILEKVEHRYGDFVIFNRPLSDEEYSKGKREKIKWV